MGHDQNNHKQAELKFMAALEDAPKRYYSTVNFGLFRLKQPKFWVSNEKVANVNFITRILILSIWLFVVLFQGLTIYHNQISKSWDLFTFDTNGNIEWIAGLEK